MADIKTRDTSRGTIKTINRAAVATERMKKAYVMPKDKAEHCRVVWCCRSNVWRRK